MHFEIYIIDTHSELTYYIPKFKKLNFKHLKCFLSVNVYYTIYKKVINVVLQKHDFRVNFFKLKLFI